MIPDAHPKAFNSFSLAYMNCFFYSFFPFRIYTNKFLLVLKIYLHLEFFSIAALTNGTIFFKYFFFELHFSTTILSAIHLIGFLDD